MHTFNRAAEKIFGYAADEVIGRHVNILIPDPRAGTPGTGFSACPGFGEAGASGNAREVRGRHKDGRIMPLDLAVSETRSGALHYFTGIVRDISRQRRAEEAIVAVSEAERRLIGQDLHDALGQQLTGLALLARALARKLDLRNDPAAEDAQGIADLAREAVTEAKRLAHGLYPTGIERLGLADALDEMAETTRRVFHVECTFSGPPQFPRLEPGVVMHLYRIAQEAVNNAVKHASGPVAIRLQSDERAITLSVADCGSGIPDPVPEGEGMGLHIMRYRARMVGGTMSFGPSSGGGACVECSLPIRVEKQVLDEHAGVSL